MNARNRVQVCPVCGGKLGFDRSAVTSETRFIYRKRRCVQCAATVYTKQPPEVVTGVEP